MKELLKHDQLTTAFSGLPKGVKNEKSMQLCETEGWIYEELLTSL